MSLPWDWGNRTNAMTPEQLAGGGAGLTGAAVGAATILEQASAAEGDAASTATAARAAMAAPSAAATASRAGGREPLSAQLSAARRENRGGGGGGGGASESKQSSGGTTGSGRLFSPTSGSADDAPQEWRPPAVGGGHGPATTGASQAAAAATTAEGAASTTAGLAAAVDNAAPFDPWASRRSPAVPPPAPAGTRASGGAPKHRFPAGDASGAKVPDRRAPRVSPTSAPAASSLTRSAPEDPSEIRVAVVHRSRASAMSFSAWDAWTELEVQIRTAAAGGATVIAWGEAAVPGYPPWLVSAFAAAVGAGAGGVSDTALARLQAAYVQQCLPIAAPQRDTADSVGGSGSGGGSGSSSGSGGSGRGSAPEDVAPAMSLLAQELGAVLVGGVVCREPHGTSIYSSCVHVTPDGCVRLTDKLKASVWERRTLSDGEPHRCGAAVTEWRLPLGRRSAGGAASRPAGALASPAPSTLVVGSLTGEDALMPLARARLHARHVQLTVVVGAGSWPLGLDIQGSSAASITPRAYAQSMALEARQWVLCVTSAVAGIPEARVLVSPTGRLIDFDESMGGGVALGVIDLSAVTVMRMDLDVAGHSARADVLGGGAAAASGSENVATVEVGAPTGRAGASGTSGGR